MHGIWKSDYACGKKKDDAPKKKRKRRKRAAQCSADGGDEKAQQLGWNAIKVKKGQEMDGWIREGWHARKLRQSNLVPASRPASGPTVAPPCRCVYRVRSIVVPNHLHSCLLIGLVSGACQKKGSTDADGLPCYVENLCT